ncbi:MAG: hypothetical protein JSW11_08890 [Candidatus Heimdallarchaeota archaeon]|nr:MAG: hypothetical protein JSW11_08890 [Candidatus Heimdallarchaeota archaeon]
MDFTRTDVFLGVLILTIIVLEYQFQIITMSNELRPVIYLTIFVFFLIWMVILVYNVANVSLEYAFSDTIYLDNKMKSRRLVRTILLICSIFLLFIGTISSVWFFSVSIIISFHLLALRAAFLLLGPEENPFKRPRMGQY